MRTTGPTATGPAPSATASSNATSGGVVSSGQFAGTVLGPGITQDRAGNIYVNGKPVQFTTGGQQGQTVGRVEAEAIRAAGGTVRPATDVLSSSGGPMPLEQYTVTNDPRSRNVPLKSSGTGSTGGRPFTSADTMEGRIAAGYAPTPNTVVDLTADPFSDPSLDGDLGSIFGGGGGETTAQRLAREAAVRGAGNQASYLSSLLSQAPNQYKTLLDAIAANRTAQETNVNTQYNTAIQNLKDRLAGAQTTTTTGYDALKAYLAANAPSAYSQLPQAQAPTLSPDSVLRYAQAIGAPTQAIGEAAVQAAAPYAGTADAYNRLLVNLQASQANAQTSRMAEEQMARTLAGQGLTAQSTAQQNALEGQRAAALDTILRQIQAQQLGVQQGQLGYEQGLQQALAGVYGTGYVAPTPRAADGSIDFSGVDFNALGRLMRGQ
jgi:hypothetical protein